MRLHGMTLQNSCAYKWSVKCTKKHRIHRSATLGRAVRHTTRQKKDDSFSSRLLFGSNDANQPGKLPASTASSHWLLMAEMMNKYHFNQPRNSTHLEVCLRSGKWQQANASQRRKRDKVWLMVNGSGDTTWWVMVVKYCAHFFAASFCGV